MCDQNDGKEEPLPGQTTVSSAMLQPGSLAIGSGAEWQQAKTLVVHLRGRGVFGPDTPGGGTV